ncbi:MAG: UDP-glucose/GDP-mannose dehydrogenase family protein [Thermodesulfovibrionales bacterium]|nr:UDP-glucose/GDP-mannose dehydrogenase family protein [Thermodesulfovibrionales bacterium]
MKLTIVGTGYVGLVTGVCLSEMGNKVICVDKDERKIETLNLGIPTIYEQGLENLLKENLKKGNITFTTDLKHALRDAEMVFIAVGTPQDDEGNADLRYVKEVARQIGQFIQKKIIVVNKSTVPVGTADLVRDIINEELQNRGVDIEFDVVSNPEFLKEGDAVNDFMKPDRVVVGYKKESSLQKLKELYAPFTRSHERFIAMDVRSAEMTKYAANAMLATKISFMNEMANICELVGADINKVRVGIGSDKRIGYHFIYPGCGFGGSCFPKDLKALEKVALRVGYTPRIIQATQVVNEAQKRKIPNMIMKRFGSVKDMLFALWGLSFKPETDDMREAPSIVFVDEITNKGARVVAYDPKAMASAKNLWFKDKPNIDYVDSKYEALKGADALVILTEWKEFRSPDFEEIKTLLKNPIIFDGRNLYDPDVMLSMGFEYYQIGYGLTKTKP